MNRLTAFGLLSLVAYGLMIGSKYTGLVSATREDGASTPVAENAQEIPGVSLAARLEPLAPQRPVSMPAPVQRSAPVRISPVALESRSARDLKAYADALLQRRGSLSADENYYLAKALEECQFATTLNEDLAAYSQKQRRDFTSRLPAEDTRNAQRVTAYDSVDSSQRCLKFQNAKIASKDIEDL